MKIDTEIRHVTRPGANLFLELGFSAEEAARLQAASRKQINDTQLLKEQLMTELADWIAQHHLKQAEAAEILMVSRPRDGDGRLFLIVNASRKAVDYQHIAPRLPPGVHLMSVEDRALLALQGPEAHAVAASFGLNDSLLAFMGVCDAEVAG